VEEAAKILCEVLGSHLAQASYPSDVCIVVEREEERQMVEHLLPRGDTNADRGMRNVE